MAERPSIVWLGAATMLAPMAVSIHVPVLPAIGRALTGEASGAEPTVSIFLWVFAAAMLVVGPVSDRVGRKPVLGASLMVYALGSVIAALSVSLPMLLLARSTQALGAAALVIVPRAIVRDAFEDTTAPMSRLATLQSIAPAIAPLVGALLGTWLGWRSTFALLVVGALAIAVWGRGLPETRIAVQTEGSALMPLAWVRLGSIAITGAATSAVYFALLPAARDVLGVFGHGSRVVGFALLFVAIGFASGAAMAPRLLRGRGRLTGVAIASVAVLAGVSLAVGLTSAVGVGVGLLVYALASGALLPLTIAEGLDVASASAGRAASILGAVQLGVGAAASSLVEAGYAFDVVATTAAVVAVLGATILLAIGSRGVQRLESSSTP